MSAQSDDPDDPNGPMAASTKGGAWAPRGRQQTVSVASPPRRNGCSVAADDHGRKDLATIAAP
jgi:hypothetical protein